MNNYIWLNSLLKNFIQDTNIKIYFEEKEKLKSSEAVINISIHPIRFADDIFFNFETNDDKVKEKLKTYQVNYDMFYHYADIVKVTFIKTVKKNKINGSRGQVSILN